MVLIGGWLHSSDPRGPDINLTVTSRINQADELSVCLMRSFILVKISSYLYLYMSCWEAWCPVRGSSSSVKFVWFVCIWGKVYTLRTHLKEGKTKAAFAVNSQVLEVGLLNRVWKWVFNGFFSFCKLDRIAGIFACILWFYVPFVRFRSIVYTTTRIYFSCKNSGFGRKLCIAWLVACINLSWKYEQRYCLAYPLMAVCSSL